MEIKKIECITCKVSHPDTLYPSDDGICVYCKADEAERIEEPQIEVEEEKTPEETEQETSSWGDVASTLTLRNILLVVVIATAIAFIQMNRKKPDNH